MRFPPPPRSRRVCPSASAARGTRPHPRSLSQRSQPGRRGAAPCTSSDGSGGQQHALQREPWQPRGNGAAGCPARSSTGASAVRQSRAAARLRGSAALRGACGAMHGRARAGRQRGWGLETACEGGLARARAEHRAVPRAQRRRREGRRRPPRHRRERDKRAAQGRARHGCEIGAPGAPTRAVRCSC